LLAPVLDAGTAAKPPRQIDLPGQKADGSVLLPNLWSLRPVGRQVAVGDFPVNIAVHPGGKFTAVLHCGHGQHEIVVVDVPGAKVVSRVALNEAFYGLAFSLEGSRLYCSGAADEVIHSFSFWNGLLSDHQEFPLRDAKERGIPAGLAVTKDQSRVWVANVLGHMLSEVELKVEGKTKDHSLTPEVKLAAASLPTPPSDPDLAAATKRDEAKLASASPDDPFPYACVLDESKKHLYVSLWALASVVVFDTENKQITATWPTEEHPNEMLLGPSGKTLFVANANRNTVSVLDTETGKTLETLSAALYAKSPPGSTPNSLALSPDGKLLFVANACNNNVAVFDVSQPGKSYSLGFIPVGWYPTSVRVTPDGKHLLVANGKGQSSRANRHGPQPGKLDPPGTVREYIGGLFKGTLSIIDLPKKREKLEEQLKEWTERAFRCTPLLADFAPTGTARRSRNNPIPARVGDRSPIRYVVYIIKENRTYDQVLGDLPQGNGDRSLCIFPEEITPNHHALAREFVLLDNFYVESEVSADGHEWSVGAYASDFVEKGWPLSYGHNQHGKYTYPSEGRFKIATPAEGYLWDRAREAGVSYRSYGEFIDNGKNPGDPAIPRAPALQGHFDPWYRCWDMDYPDVKRAERFIAELRRFEKEGGMPRLQIMRLPNDHTYGTSAGKPTPRAMVADNDLAFGRVVEALSRSKFWPRLAIFVVEDDAQNGPDHVDAHRTIAYAISPYVKRGFVDSTMYTTSSMLRTMELILGLRPMSQFDAAATPMFNSFQASPNLRSYKARPVTVDLNEQNPKTAWGSDLSEKMNFAKEDDADDLLLNEVIWRSVKGSDHPMPAPRRAAFVFSRAEDEDD
jgi:YVTN family beta-propeller protein